jgi:hypothetical protein
MSAEHDVLGSLKRLRHEIEEQIAKRKEELAKLKRKLSGVKNSEKHLLGDDKKRSPVQPDSRANVVTTNPSRAEQDSNI